MFNYILYRIGEFLVLHLSKKWGYRLAEFISNLQYIFSTRDRKTVSGNLKAIFPGIRKHQLRKYTRGVFNNFAKYLADFLKSRKIGIDYINKNLKIEGLEHIDNCLAKKKGVIIVSAHIGPWELGGLGLGIKGYPISAVALSHKHKKVDNFFNTQREINGMKVIPLARAGRSCFETLRRNEILCLVGDRDFTQGGIVVNFFGRHSMIPRGPAALSIKTGAPIVAAFTIRTPNDKFILSFNPPIEYSPSSTYERDLIKLTEIYLKQIEECIRNYPMQWFMFRKFWI